MIITDVVSYHVNDLVKKLQGLPQLISPRVESVEIDDQMVCVASTSKDIPNMLDSFDFEKRKTTSVEESPAEIGSL